MHRTLSLVLLAALAPLGGRAGAQTVTLTSPAPLLDRPAGRAVATLRAGSPLDRGATRASHTAITLEGWVDSSAVRPARRGEWQLIVRTPATLRSSAAAGAAVVAELPTNMGLKRVSRRGAWVQVRRDGWVANSRLPRSVATRSTARGTVASESPAVVRAPATTQKAPATAQKARTVTPPAPSRAPAAAATASVPVAATARRDSAPPAGALTPSRTATLRDAPDGARELGALAPNALLMPMLRDRGWVKVRVEGWVREDDVLPADTALRATLTAADLRADPNGTRGRQVRWDVEFLAFRTADPLRRDLVNGEPYMLARGPGSENALLYLALPPSLVEQARGLPALAPLTVTARVRSGRSEPSGVPVLDVLSLTRR